jgi:hypothetical protein
VAASLSEALGVEAEVMVGDRGEFSVVVDGKIVAKRNFLGPPSPRRAVRAVRKALK